MKKMPAGKKKVSTMVSILGHSFRGRDGKGPGKRGFAEQD
jgi:hypothetical protein